jgi:Uncharacterized alpha/beta hydrolase domain (DUF2235)
MRFLCGVFQTGVFMAKNIVLLSDGTGNSSASVFKTNVWRLFQILDLRRPEEQIAFYDDGVGTSSFKLFAALGGIFGFGLKRNVIAIYSFCCRNYRPGDRIYCFGFSRGAFTIRVVAGLIASQGLVKYEDNEADLARFAADAYRNYRRRFDGGILRYLRCIRIDLRGIRDAIIRGWRRLRGQAPVAPDPVTVDSIHFVGVWDTVDAYGGPIQEMTRAIDYWIWPLSMPDRFMGAKVLRACHALSLEDERDAFTPVVWDERYVRAKASVNGVNKDWLFTVDHDPRDPEAKAKEPLPQAREHLPPVDRQRISQVWFTGVHADVGGGYPQNGLSFVALDWMMDRAAPYGLLYLDEQRQLLIDPQIDPTDKLNDSRKGLASYYRYKPRNLKELYEAPPYKPSIADDWRTIRRLARGAEDTHPEISAELHPSAGSAVLPTPLPTIHESVFGRIAGGTDRYAPVVVPAPRAYRVTGKDGAISGGPDPVDPGEWRSSVQDDVWNWIWLRRVVYFLTAFATAFVVFIPFFVIYWPEFGRDTVGSFVNPVVNTAASFLPGFLEPWFVAFRDAPGFVLIGAIAVGVLMLIGKNLQETIHDASRVAWHTPSEAYVRLTGWRAAVYQLRRYRIYRVFFYVLTHWVVPTAIMWWLFWWLAFGTANTLGLFCKPTGHAIDVTEQGATGQKSVGYADIFFTRELCHPTGLKVTHGERYQITLRIPDGDPWIDKVIPADPGGFVLGSWKQIGGIPFKRLIWSNWFRPIVRVGSTGLEEHLPDFVRDTNDRSRWSAEFIARSDGEVFVYVNDTSIFFPRLLTAFYDNNKGSAWVELKRL